MTPKHQSFIRAADFLSILPEPSPLRASYGFLPRRCGSELQRNHKAMHPCGIVPTNHWAMPQFNQGRGASHNLIGDAGHPFHFTRLLHHLAKLAARERDPPAKRTKNLDFHEQSLLSMVLRSTTTNQMLLDAPHNLTIPPFG